MRNMKRVVCRGLLMIVLSFAASRVQAQTPPRPHVGRDTWYEFLLKQCNRGNFDYGTWLERRRQAFLEATAKEPYFWYSMAVTAGMLIMMVACTKLHVDNRRSVRVAAEMMADIYNHDLLSRQAATEAIEKYNRHIEQCNREIESAESGEGRPGWRETQIDTLKAELQRVTSQLEATTQDRNKLQEELRQKSLVVADLSVRLDALSKKVDGARSSGGVPREAVSAGASEDGARFVGHINRLQEELYAERQKNNRVKGG